MDDFKIGDIVEITHQPTNKWGRIIETPSMPMLYGGGSVRIEFFEDGSKLYMSTYLLKKWTEKELLPTRCPICASLWHKVIGFNHDYFECTTCNVKKEDMIKKISNKIK